MNIEETVFLHFLKILEITLNVIWHMYYVGFKFREKKQDQFKVDPKPL